MPDIEEIQKRLLELLARIEVDAEEVGRALASWGDEAASVLGGIARGEVEADSYQRANALSLWGSLGGARASDDLAQLLAQEPAPGLRLAAMDGMRRAGGPAARKALVTIAVTAEADVSERLWALEWLAEIGQDEDLEQLERLEPSREDVALAQRLEAATKTIRYRTGAGPRADDSEEENEPPEPDG